MVHVLAVEVLCLAQISILNARAGYAEIDANDAESRVEAVMAAAADAVTAELEAQAVSKETEVALEKATSEIEALTPEADMCVGFTSNSLCVKDARVEMLRLADESAMPLLGMISFSAFDRM